jgi:hypothetical protein
MTKAMVNNPEATAKVFSAGLKHAASASAPPKRASPGFGNAEEEKVRDVMIGILERLADYRGGMKNRANLCNQWLVGLPHFHRVEVVRLRRATLALVWYLQRCVVPGSRPGIH